MKSLIASICILGMVGAVIGITVWAAEDTITCSVTARNIAISVTDGTIDYGNVDLSSSTSTLPTAIDDAQTASNDGSAAQISVKTSDATPPTGWTSVESFNGSNDEFIHSFTTTTSPTWQVITEAGEYETASSTVESGGTLDFYFQIETDNAYTDYTAKSITITVQAAAP